MACRKTKSLRSLTLCGMSGIDGNPPGASTSRKRMVGNVRLAFNPGRINCCKKSCASSLTPTLSLSLAPIPTGSDQNGDVTRHCGKSTTTGWERFGSSRATSRNVSIMHLDAPLKNASSGNCQTAAVETVPMSSANPETKTGACWDLCRRESCHYGYDHKSNVGQCQGLLQSAKSSALPRTAWGATASAFERCRV